MHYTGLASLVPLGWNSVSRKIQDDRQPLEVAAPSYNSIHWSETANKVEYRARLGAYGGSGSTGSSVLGNMEAVLGNECCQHTTATFLEASAIWCATAFLVKPYSQPTFLSNDHLVICGRSRWGTFAPHDTHTHTHTYMSGYHFL